MTIVVEMNLALAAFMAAAAVDEVVAGAAAEDIGAFAALDSVVAGAA